LELGCIYAVAKKIMEFSLPLSLSRTIYLNAKFYNQPTQKLWISFCAEFSQYKFYKSTKTPKSHGISLQNSLLVQIPTNPKTQRSWNSLKISLSLSLNANSIDQPSQKPQKSCHPLQNDLSQCKLCKSIKNKPKIFK
jgi:hypothetical protein